MSVPKCSVCEDYHFPGDCEWKEFLREHDPEWEEDPYEVVREYAQRIIRKRYGENFYPGKIIQVS